MTAEVRRHIRTKRDLHGRARMTTRHVEFCVDCGGPFDRKGRMSEPVCRSCANKRVAAAA